MAGFNKFNSFGAALANKKHDLANDQITIALSNTMPTATDSVIADITEIDYTNLSSRDIVTASSTHHEGTYSLVIEDLVLIATGVVPDFRYVIFYNSTAAGGLLIGWYDSGNTHSLVDGGEFIIKLIEEQTLFEIE